MEEENKVYTQEEIDEILKTLRLVFPIVRVLKETEVCGRKVLEGSGKPCKCFEFWGKDKACENCISIVSLLEHSTKTKIELLDGEYYQVYSKYVNIEGNNCVIEMIRNLGSDSIVDPDTYNHYLKNNNELNDSLYTDPLTGAKNRLYYEQKKNLRYKNTGVAVIDIDNFKNINDTFGHRIGDVILQKVFDKIISNVRSNDDVIRMGSDEIVLVFPDMSASKLQNKLESLKDEVSEINIIDHPNIHITLSIGATIAESDNLDNLVTKADGLMYKAKISRDCIVTDWQSNTNLVVDKENDKPIILIVDDAEMNRLILRSFLESDYQILEAKSGEECIDIVEKLRSKISLIMLDLVMPGLDGFGVLSILNTKEYFNNIPVIMISAEDKDEQVIKAFELGISDYIKRPFVAKVVKQRVNNTVKLYLKQKKFEVKVKEQLEENDKISNMMSYILSFIVGYRNNESGPHVLHVEQITEILIDELNLTSTKYYISPIEKKNIVYAAGMHDIGKIGIDEKILNKPGKLTNEEYDEMKKHTLIGANMMTSMTMYTTEPFVNMVYQICRWHHEKWDGRGYPDGLKGDDIPIAPQIVSVADVYDALVSPRVYKAGFPHEKAVEMILNGECGAFNPALLKCLMNAKDRIKRIYELESEDVIDTRN